MDVVSGLVGLSMDAQSRPEEEKEDVHLNLKDLYKLDAINGNNAVVELLTRTLL